MVDSITDLHKEYGVWFYIIEWTLTGLFSLEYILRLISVRSQWRYARSWLGIIDLLAILPMYISFLFPGAQSLLVLRSLRILRVFRIFRLTHYISEMRFLSFAIKSSLKKISIFMLVVLMLVIIMGSLMYLVEPDTPGFENIPASIYWAIVTITTVGYGDVAPITPIGKFIASSIMMLGYGIIAVPTGIITTEMALAARTRGLNHEVCPGCGKEGHDEDARFCKRCGEKL